MMTLKKTVAAVAAIAVVAGAAASFATPVSAATGTLTAATIDMTLAELEACDYTVEVAITLPGNPGFSALGFGLTDGDLEYQEVANNCGASMLGDANNGDFTWFNLTSTKLVTKETIATVTVKVPETAAEGDSYPLELTGTDANGNAAAYANDLAGGAGDLGGYDVVNGAINIIAEETEAPTTEAEETTTEAEETTTEAVVEETTTTAAAVATPATAAETTKAAAAAATTSTASSPKTGDALPIAGVAVAVAVVGGIALVSKKRK